LAGLIRLVTEWVVCISIFGYFVDSSAHVLGAEPDHIMPTFVLHNGQEVPLVGLGCASGVRQAHVVSALKAGYRFLDTAQSYRWGYHEDEVGSALQQVALDSSDPAFIQTKIHPEDLGFNSTKRAVEVSQE